MKKKNYLNNMVFKPDYVVTYNEDGTYSGKALNENLYKNHSLIFINGYAASKSHPDEPVLISISLPCGTVSAETAKNLKVYKLNPDTYLKEVYTGKHDLFIYVLARNAILAGKEMSLYDEADSYVNMCKDAVNPAIEKFNEILNNPLYRRMGQGFVELLNQKLEKYKNNFEPTYTATKDKAKDVYDKAKNSVRTGVNKLVDELRNNSNKQSSFTTCKYQFETCKFYKELTKKWAVLLKHSKNSKGESKYYLEVFDLELDERLRYYLTNEQFCNIYDILFDNVVEGDIKFYSIIDVIKEDGLKPINNNPKQYNNANKNNTVKSEKTLPIQMCEFRDEDVVPSSTQFKRKFNIDDKVMPKRGKFAGKIGTIYTWYKDDNNKIKYLVQFDKLNIIVGFYAYQLNKL